MSEITSAMVKELREKTGVGMMDCKLALKENNGNIESSIDWLRTKGIAKAAKKEGRVASEGLISIENNGNVASVIEVNSETDFVARNEDFQKVVKKLSALSLESENLDELIKKQVDERNISVKDYITETGKILPARITGVSAKVQRKITKAVKTARFLALLPYSDNHN